MKKSLLFLSCLFYASTSLASADVITSPFYAPKKGESLSKTTAMFYEKKVIAQNFTFKQYNQTLEQGYLYGISDKVAIDLNIQNSWERRRGDIVRNEDTNINWPVGAVYSFMRSEKLLQAQVLYRQNETHHARGAYKELYGRIQTGYDFGSVLPYIGAAAELPVAQSKHEDDKMQADAYVGLYGVIKDKVSADAQLVFHYDDNDASKEYRVDTEVSYLITPKFAFSVFGKYVLSDKGDQDSEAKEKTVGIRFKAGF